MNYTIGETADKIGVAASTLRYYDKEGLLPFVERTNGGIRRFKDEDLSWLVIIECLKKTGMSIKNIKLFIDWCIEGDATIDKRLALITAQRESVEKQIAELNGTLEVLKYKQWYYETAAAAGTCDIHKNMNPDDVPAALRTERHTPRELNVFEQ